MLRAAYADSTCRKGRAGRDSEDGKPDETLRPAPIIMGLIASDVPLLDHKGLVVPWDTKTIVGAVTFTLHTKEVAPPGQHLLWTFATPSVCTEKIDQELELWRFHRR